MRDKESSIKTLVDFGISRTQAKVYLTLADKGTLTLRAASELSGVGRPDTYRAMLDLKKEGLIETILDAPTRYRAVKISDAISILMGQKRKEIMNLKEKSNKLLTDFQQKTANQVNVSDTEFIIVPKGAASIKKRSSAIKNAEYSVDCITSFKRFNQTLLVAGDDIINAAERGVKIRFILDKFVVNKPLSKEFEMFCKNSSCEVRFVRQPPQALVTIFDKKEAQIAMSEEGDLTQMPMLWSNNVVLVRICQHYFETNWLGKTQTHGIFEEIKIN
jgi:HTH-type transcriptional regulator, sugar sensing transcriptional regulator